MKFLQNKKIILLISFIIIGLVIRLTWVLVNDIHREPLADGYYYYTLANSLIKGEGYSINGTPHIFRPPGYPLFLALLLYLHNSYETIYISNIVLGIILMILIYILAKILFNENVALISVFLSSFYIPLIMYEPLFIRSNLLTPILFLSTIILINSLKKEKLSLVLFIVLGILLGYAILIRGFILLYLIILIISLFIFLKRMKLSLVISSILILFVILVLTPWIIRNFTVFDCFIPVCSNSALAFMGSNNSQVLSNPYLYGKNLIPHYLPEKHYLENIPDLCDRLKAAYSITFKFLWDNFKEIPRLLFYKFRNFWNPLPKMSSSYKRVIYSIIYIPMLIYSMLGAILSIKNRVKYVWLLFIPVVALQLTILIYFGNPRLRNPIEPIIVIFSAYGIYNFWSFLQNWWKEKRNK